MTDLPTPTPLDPTLTRQAAQLLIVLAADLQGLLDTQAAAELDAESADKDMAQAENDLRSIGRRLAEIRKGTRAAWLATVLPFPSGGAA